MLARPGVLVLIQDRSPNLVIFRIGSIGDTVVAMPCFHAIARAFPRHRKILLTNAVASARASSVETVLEGTGLIDGALYFPVGRGKLSHSVELARQLRELSAEALVYLAPRTTGLQVYRDLLFFRAAGIRRVIGAPLKVGARECRVDAATGDLEHEAERLARILGAEMPVDLAKPGWDLRLSNAEQEVSGERLSGLLGWRPIVVLSPGAKIPAKDWGEERWGALIRLLQVRVPAISLVFVGAPDERQLTERLAQLWSGPKVNLCGELTPRESAAVMGHCDLLVCHDSGPMHLAASQGTRCVALFGNFNRPRQWFPWGSEHVVIYEPYGMSRIDVERVADAVEAVLHSLHTDTTREPRVVRSAS
jgi:lipopolysaccharide heptosyltransferase III